MSRPPPLTADRIRAELRDHPKWTLQEDAARAPHVVSIRRDYVFPTFRHVIEFMADTAKAIDRIDHHPAWKNTYNRLTVELNTWDGGGGVRNTVTDLDVELAKILDERAPKFFESTPPDFGTVPRSPLLPTVHADSKGVIVTGRHAGPILHVAWSPDGTQVAVAASEVYLWTVDGAPIQKLHLREEQAGKQIHTLTLSWSADGRELAAGTSDGRVDVWKVSEAPPTFEQIGWPSGVRVLNLCWSPHRRALVGVGEDTNVRVWFPGKGEADWQCLVLRRPEHSAVSYRSVLWAPDDSILAGASDGQIDRWVTGPGGWGPDAAPRYSPFERNYGHGHWVTGLAASRDGSQVVSVGSDRTLRIWNTSTGTIDADADGRLRILRDLPEIPTSVGYAARDSVVAVGSPWGTVALYDTAKWTASKPVRLAGEFTAGEVNVTVSPTEARAALVGPERDRVWMIPISPQPQSLPARKARVIFVSYAHADLALRKEFRRSVVMLEREKRVTIFTDGEITAGEEWGERIRSMMAEADVFVLLVSPDFVESEFISTVEMGTALDRHHLGTARVIPILIRPTAFIAESTDSPLHKLQWLPTGREPVTKWADRDSAWVNVAQGLRDALDAMEGDGSR